MLDNAVFKLKLSAQLVSHKLKCPSDRRTYLGLLDRLELEHRTAAYYRIVDIKIRIFRSRCDKGYAAVLDIFKQRLLLFFVKVLYLVKIKQYAVEPAKGLCLCDYLFDIGYRRRCAVELVQLHIGRTGDKPCKRCLADARGTVEYHIGYALAFDYPAKRHIFPDKMLLSDNVIERFRSYSFRQRYSHF